MSTFPAEADIVAILEGFKAIRMNPQSGLSRGYALGLARRHPHNPRNDMPSSNSALKVRTGALNMKATAAYSATNTCRLGCATWARYHTTLCA